MAEDFTIRTPGQIMRAAREERGQSLHDAQEGTKIPIRLLEAIEGDEYHKLSGPLYVKSFLRNYAGWLGLNTEEILAVYELATGRPEQMASSEAEVWTEEKVAVTRVGMPWARLMTMAVAAIVVLLVVVVVAVRIFGGGDRDGGALPAGDAAADTAAQRTVVTRAQPAEAEPASAEPTTAEPAPKLVATAPADGPGASRVQSETQPASRSESRQQRLERLTRGRIVDEEPTTVQPTPEETTNVEPTPVEAARTGEREVAPPPASTAAKVPAGQAAPPRRGDPDLRFVGGATFPLVLRVLLPEPANCTVRRDDQPDAVPVIWPDRPVAPPAYNLRHGMAYAVAGGYAIYWGASDHFTLTLDRTRGVEVTLNGHPQSLRDWRPGQTKLLDTSRLPAGGG